LLAIGIDEEEGVADIPPAPICGTIAITFWLTGQYHCTLEAKNSGLETIPDVAPTLSQINEFLRLCRLEVNEKCRELFDWATFA
jgi:hypothetical protein